MDSRALDRLITELENAAQRASWDNRPNRGEVWGQIRTIGGSFKDTRYPTKVEKDEAWERFQGIVESIKQAQGAQQQRRADFDLRSGAHKERILWHARRARPVTGFIADLLDAGQDMVDGVIDALLPSTGAYDKKKAELQAFEAELREAWDYFNQYKQAMTGEHKREVFEELQEVRGALDSAWGEWKEAKHRAWEARQRAFEERQSAWRERVETNIRKLRGDLNKAYSALERCEANLRRNEEKRDSAWNDDFRVRVEGWIEEDQERIRDIRASIDRLEGWLEEAEAKLR